MAEEPGINTEDLKAFQDYIRREFMLLMRPPTAALYHYTSGAAAADILGQARLRATNILHLDDGREMQYSLDYFGQAMDERRRHQDGGVSAKLTDMITRYMAEKGSHVLPDIWVATFTAIRDDAAQWRASARGTHGVAFGFGRAGMLRAAESSGGLLAPCCYDDGTKFAIMKRGLDLIERLYDRQLKRGGRAAETGEALVRRVVRETALFGALMKPADMAGQEEWRLILCNPSQTAIGARRINALARPDYTSLYIDLEIGDANGRLPIDEIVIGPSPHQQKTERAFRTLLYKYGYDQARVTPSPAF